MIMKKLLLIQLILICLFVGRADQAGAQDYDPADVAVINEILKINDAKSGVLATAGWKVDQPETWLKPKGQLQLGGSLIWNDGRLESMNLSFCKLTGAVDLSALSGLKSLSLSSNYLTAIKGLDKTGLTVLEAGGNRLEDIGDLSGLVGLTTLDVSENKLTDIGDLSGLVKLTAIIVNDNQLIRLGDLSRMPGLVHLKTSNNRLTDLGDLSDSENLSILDVADNRLTRLGNLGKMTRLRVLQVGNNDFENMDFLKAVPDSLRSFGFSGDQLSGLTLTDSGFNNLNTLRVTGTPGFQELDLNNRPLDRLELAGRLTADQIKNVGPIDSVWILADANYSLADLVELRKKLNPSKQFFAGAQAVKLGDVISKLKPNKAYSLTDLSPKLAAESAAGGPSARILVYDNRQFRWPIARIGGPDEDSPDERPVTFKNGQVVFIQEGDYYLGLVSKDISFRAGSENSDLYMTITNYQDVFAVADETSLPPARETPELNYDPADVAVINTLLENNDANGTLAENGWRIGQPQTWTTPKRRAGRTASLVWNDNGRLEKIDLSFNQLAGALDLSGLSELKSLTLSHNQLTSILGLDSLPSVTTVKADYNSLTAIGDMGRLSQLTELNLDRNQLADIGDLSGLKKLTTLLVRNNHLSHLGNLGGLRLLENIWASGNQLTDIGDLSNLRNLRVLDVADNQLTSLGSLEKMKLLRYLYLGSNPFVSHDFMLNIPPRVENFGFSGDQLPTFTLADNYLVKLETLKISGSPEFKHLDLNGRSLETLELSGRVAAGQIKNPGPVRVVSFSYSEPNNYSMSDLRALRDKLNPSEHFRSGKQSVTLGDLAAELEVNRQYALSEISPRLAEDYAAAGPSAALKIYRDRDRFMEVDNVSFTDVGLERSEAMIINDGRLTFTVDGDFYLSLTSRDIDKNVLIKSEDQNYMLTTTVEYQDIVHVKAR